MDKELLEIIVCPACRQKLAHDEAQQTLTCAGCGRVHPIRDGIPVLLVEEARASSASK